MCCVALLLVGMIKAAPAQVPTANAELPAAAAATTGTITGTVIDPAGAVMAGVRVTFSGETTDPETLMTTRTDNDGTFVFNRVNSGAFVLRVEAKGFINQDVHGVLIAGQVDRIPDVELTLAGTVTDVRVSQSANEIAQEQVHQEEKQRVFGAIPNFYVSYARNPQPLSSKQKFNLAWKTLLDPSSYVLIGASAGIEQADNAYSGYGQGAAGYGRRYGAAYGDFISGVMLGNAILPSLFKQDPRYFYQGTGTVRSRAGHAIARSVFCQGDNGRRQFDYSDILGGLASGGLSNLYYPAQNRNGAAVTFEGAAIGIAGSAFGNLVQEFLLHKVSTGVDKSAASRP